jgi:hypothetical protein
MLYRMLSIVGRSTIFLYLHNRSVTSVFFMKSSSTYILLANFSSIYSLFSLCSWTARSGSARTSGSSAPSSTFPCPSSTLYAGTRSPSGRCELMKSSFVVVRPGTWGLPASSERARGDWESARVWPGLSRQRETRRAERNMIVVRGEAVAR